ncbi:hypothetical protein KY495_00150 [Massilia sp. PAMC28688]|uniref:hypothetical protein n=1 Tax=Massilia sp. PAMC28688 TaxID=2861283 RepID=UPI001C62D613|nr:hypothetical protein [Massilia sp. PAMC28688]QYF93692.1 hypothetical protein KY495_00150 [Massilia sp. PAMC28688]
MNRRVDEKTAELVEMALLTKAAFGPHLARRYVQIKDADSQFMREILARPANQTRSRSSAFCANCEGRRREKRS